MHTLPIDFGPFSVFGIGCGFFAYRPVEDRCYVVTRWITIFYVPIVPLWSLKIRPISYNHSFGAIDITRREFENVGFTRPDLLGMLRTFLGTLQAAGPTIAAIAACDHVHDPQMRKVIAMGAIASVFWFMGCIWLQRRGERRIYELSQRDRSAEFFRDSVKSTVR